MDRKANLPIKPDSSSPDFLRDVQAALKRHRPLGTRQSNCIRLKRTLLPQPQDSLSLRNNNDASITPPSISSKSSTVNPSQTNTVPQGANVRKATELENLSSHMSSLGFTEMEWVEGNQLEASNDSTMIQSIPNFSRLSLKEE